MAINAPDRPTLNRGAAMQDTDPTVEELQAALDKSRAETRGAFENRALMYAYLYEELLPVLGREETVALMKRAIYRRGLEVGRKYRAAAQEGDLAEVGNIFCSGSPCAGGLFDPGIEERADGRIVLRMTSCPLIDAWREVGLPAEEIDTLCEIAAAVDEGTFDGAGLELRFLSRLGAGEGKCLLDLRVPSDE
jgi:hypothetical protein